MVTNAQILSALYAIAPQFVTEDSSSLERYYNLIELLRCQVNETRLCCNATLAYAYLLAHMLTVNPSTGAAGTLQEGELTIKYAVDASSSVLAGTAYGRSYLDLVKRTVFAPFVTTGYRCAYPIGFPYVI